MDQGNPKESVTLAVCLAYLAAIVGTVVWLAILVVSITVDLVAGRTVTVVLAPLISTVLLLLLYRPFMRWAKPRVDAHQRAKRSE